MAASREAQTLRDLDGVCAIKPEYLMSRAQLQETIDGANEHVADDTVESKYKRKRDDIGLSKAVEESAVDTCAFAILDKLCSFPKCRVTGPSELKASAEAAELNNLTGEAGKALRTHAYQFYHAPARTRPPKKGRKQPASEPKTADTAPTRVGPVVPLEHKPFIDFHRKVIVAPLTTVGNLPFRRVCTDLGADITVGEMALANQLLAGHRNEWALVRRHASEKTFGVQVAGSNTDMMAQTAEVLDREASVDFVDLNIGCPIDVICNRGMGAKMMGRTKKVLDIAAAMRRAMRCPVTIKMRMGIMDDKPIAAKLIRQIRATGNVNAVFVHGRSRQQRYTRAADWNYIGECARIAREDDVLMSNGDFSPPMQLIGNGDVFSYEEWNNVLETSGADTALLARGVLIKPWLCTEIQERKLWDISAPERLDILKSYVSYGLEHWGCDAHGVARTRRYLLEWLSFLCRYVPVGLLERVPQRMTEKPLAYFGRSDLETLLGSRETGDWIKISEMLLGPVPDGFKFVPKHRANAYAVSDALLEELQNPGVSAAAPAVH